ncbi:MAG TPA: hypothetical protein VJ600_08655 [Holophagaceae bacterium]|nr:hypothetical protein [Holophagaceae bacterium]
MKPLELIEQGRFLGEEFVLWLWWRGLAEGGVSGLDGDHSACFLDDSVVLASERGDVKELSLRKGNPAESREAFEALSRGMRPFKAKVRLLSGDMEWVFTLDAATLGMGALKLPPSSAKDPQGRMLDRLFLLEEGAGHLERRLKRFLEDRSGDPEAMQEAMRGWIRLGLTGEIGLPPVGQEPAGDEVPWRE